MPLRRLVRFSPGFAHVPCRGVPGNVRGPDIALQLPRVAVSFERFLADLPAPMPQPRDALEQWGALGLDTLGFLASAGIVEEAIVDPAGTDPACARRPVLPAPPPPDGAVVLSPATCLRRDGTRWLLLGTGTRALVTLSADALGALVKELSEPTPVRDLSPVARLLLDQGLLDLQGASSRLDPWSFHDALFHAASVHGFGTAGGYGARPDGTERQPRTGPAGTDSPARAEQIGDGLPDPAISLADTLALRRTCRSFSTRALPRAVVEALLRLALRDRPREPVPDAWDATFHAYPSGGARGEITTLLATVDDGDDAVARYDSRAHALAPLETASGTAARIIDRLSGVCGIGTPRPSAALIFAADYGRMAAKYEAIAYATILRNVGAIYQTVSLCAEALGIGSCCVGGGWSPVEREDLAGTLRGDVVVGAMLLGERASAP